MSWRGCAVCCRRRIPAVLQNGGPSNPSRRYTSSSSNDAPTLTTTSVPRTQLPNRHNYEISFPPDAKLERQLSRKAMYRKYIQNLRLLPDPHVWRVFLPQMRALCQKLLPEGVEPPDPPAEDEEWKKRKIWVERTERERALRKATDLLNELRAAVAVHPHALSRLVEEAYGLRGRQRYDRLQHLIETSPKTQRTGKERLILGDNRISIPECLSMMPQVLKPPRDTYITRIRPRLPKTGARQMRIKWKADLTLTPVPMIMPQVPEMSLPRTGWEGQGVAEALRMWAGVGKTVMPLDIKQNPPKRVARQKPRGNTSTIITDLAQLPTYNLLTPQQQRLFPRNLKPTRREPLYPVPSYSKTRTNPRTWATPRSLDVRMLRRTYHSVWERSVWVKPVLKKGSSNANNLTWEQCTYDDIVRLEAEHDLTTKATKDITRDSGQARNRLQYSEATEMEVAFLKETIAAEKQEAAAIAQAQKQAQDKNRAREQALEEASQKREAQTDDFKT